MTLSTDDFRAALGRWASGVTIVTSRAGERIHGMTVSDFGGVSAEPPMVLVCADKGAVTLEVIREGRCFAVNVLARDQEALSNKFASKKQEWERFEGLEYDAGPTGAPLLQGTVANLDCRVVGSHEHGDHVVCVGEVVDVRVSDRKPLLYFGGGYGDFA